MLPPNGQAAPARPPVVQQAGGKELGGAGKALGVALGPRGVDGIVDELGVAEQLAQGGDGAQDAAGALPVEQLGGGLAGQKVVVQRGLEGCHAAADHLHRLGRQVRGEERVGASQDEVVDERGQLGRARGVPRDDVACSGYGGRGRDEEGFREFKAAERAREEAAAEAG